MDMETSWTATTSNTKNETGDSDDRALSGVGLWPLASRLWGVPIPPRAWMSVSCECCVLSGGGIYDGPIPLPEESYRVCVCVSLSATRCNNNSIPTVSRSTEVKTKKQNERLIDLRIRIDLKTDCVDGGQTGGVLERVACLGISVWNFGFFH
jgi:hypothetical protein